MFRIIKYNCIHIYYWIIISNTSYYSVTTNRNILLEYVTLVTCYPKHCLCLQWLIKIIDREIMRWTFSERERARERDETK